MLLALLFFPCHIDSSQVRTSVKAIFSTQVDALGKKLRTDLEAGLPGTEDDLQRRRDAFGTNTFPEKAARSLLVSALQLAKVCREFF